MAETKWLMTAREVIDVCVARGLKVLLLPDGSPTMKGDRKAATPPLLEALKLLRGEIIDYLKEHGAPPETAPRPGAIWWKLKHAILCRVLREPAWGSYSNHQKATLFSPIVPYGAVAWGLDGEHWHALEELPQAWNLIRVVTEIEDRSDE